MDHFRSSNASGKPPNGLAGVLNKPEDQRDSAYYSNADAQSSKHNSTMSTNGTALTPSSGCTSPLGDTPSPITAPYITQSLNSTTSGGMSVASMVLPTSAATTDQAMLNRLNRHSYESGPGSAGLNDDAISRRESVDSRLGQNFGSLQLASSPYASNNQSTTSIQGTLQQQRNPVPDRNSASRFSNSYQPNTQRLPDPLSPKSSFKQAPTITGPTLSNIARAAEPTKGQAWAFPDQDKLPSAAHTHEETNNRAGTSFLDSRRSSIADSIASSQLTTESRYPLGQRRLDEGLPLNASSEYPSTHHHHSLQNRQLGDLQSDDAGSPASGQPYSRTPELRVSHKLAERKRRTEMKELFDQLRDLMPQERGSKASKWEILTKAIGEHQRLIELLDKMDHALRLGQSEQENFRREATALRHENSQLRAQLHEATANQFQTNGHPSHAAPPVDMYGPDTYGRGPRADYQNRSELPPLRAPESMSGIQYQSGYTDRRF